MANFWAILKALPQIWGALKGLFGMFLKLKKDAAIKKNAEAIKKVEDAKTPEELQAGLNDVAKRLNN